MSRTAPPLCDNWACPAWVSCALAVGRSPEFAAADTRGVEIETRHVLPGKDSCNEYRQDKARPWLMRLGPVKVTPEPK